jgi:hypothetical protein
MMIGRVGAVALGGSALGLALLLRAWSDGALEQHSGTALYASAVYAAVLFVRPAIRPVPAATIAVGFCWAVEFFQLTGVPAALSAHSLLARLALGVRFDPVDVAWYPVGVVVPAVLRAALSVRGSRTSRDRPNRTAPRSARR